MPLPLLAIPFKLVKGGGLAAIGIVGTGALVNYTADTTYNASTHFRAAANNVNEFASSLFSTGEGILSIGQSFTGVGRGLVDMGTGFANMIAQAFSVAPYILIMLLGLVLFLCFCRVSFSRARNNRHSLRRLQMLQDHQVRMLIAQSSGVDTMNQF